MTLKIRTDKKGKFVKYKSKKYYLPKSRTFTQAALIKWIVKQVTKKRSKIRTSIKGKLKKKTTAKVASSISTGPSPVSHGPPYPVSYAPGTTTAATYAALLNAQQPQAAAQAVVRPQAPSTALVTIPGFVAATPPPSPRGK